MAQTKPWSFNVHLFDIGLDEENKFPSQKQLDDALESAKKAFTAIRDLGGTFVRTDFSWKFVQPDKPRSLADPTDLKFKRPVIDFFRRYVEAARAGGIEVICILYQTPNWAKDECRRDPNAFYLYYKDYCKTIATEMGGTVHYYQLWNEPNNLFSFTDARKDQFAATVNFPQMFYIAETGLHEAGYPWESMLNFLVNVVTDAELVSQSIDLTFGTVVNGMKLFRDWVWFFGLISQEQYDALTKAIADLGIMENLYANCFSWKRSLNYFVDMNHEVNKNNRITIYGVDHYPGTWSKRPYEDWSPLDDMHGIISKHGPKSLAVLETGFPTWEMDSEFKPSVEILEGLALKLTLQIAKPVIDLIRPFLDWLSSSLPEFIRKLFPTPEQIEKMFTDTINPTIVAALKYTFLSPHTYQEQAVWIDKSLGSLYTHQYCSELKFMNWYELKDHDSTPPSVPQDIAGLFDIPEKKFGILLRDEHWTPKKGYANLKSRIHSATRKLPAA